MQHLENMGYYLSGGMGAVPLTFSEIQSYIDTTGIPLNSEEVLLIKKASTAYVSQMNDKSPFAKAPYQLEQKIQLDNSEIYRILGV